LKDIIIEAVDSSFLLKIEDKTLGFLNVSVKQMITQLCNRGGTLDFADTKTLLAKRDKEWDISKVHTIYFNQVEKAIKQLICAGITSDLKERTDTALYYLKKSGEFDAAVREWEQKATVDKMWTNINTLISAKYATENKQNKLTAKQFQVNIIEEQAEVTKELIANLTEAHTRLSNPPRMQ
jgi:hypothetical protein